jgi:hypothetical protein
MLSKLLWLVDVQEASASVEADHARILADVEAMPGGAVHLNAVIKGAINGAVETTVWLQRAVQGDGDAAVDATLTATAVDGCTKVVCCLAAGCYTTLLSAMLTRVATSDELDCDVDGAMEGDEEGVAPLHFATRSGHAGAVRLLLDHAADVDASTAGGRTSLMLAAELGLLDCVNVLLRADPAPDLEARDEGDATALIYAQSAASSGCELTFDAIWAAAEFLELGPSDMLC